MDLPYIIGEKKIQDIIPEYFITGFHLNPEEVLDIELIDPAQLLVPERIDIVCKLYYIDCLEKKRNIAFATELYKEHLRAFSQGSFTEPGQEFKNTFEKYIDCFEKMIDDIKDNGFDVKKSVVPVGENGIIIDGSHRVAIAIYYGIPIPIVRLHNVKVNYNYEFFERRELGSLYLDFMAFEYVKRVENSFVSFIWPSVSMDKRVSEAEKLIRESSNIVYKKNLRLSYHGLEQLMIQIYGKEPWAGNIMNGFSGIGGKARPCYAPDSFTTVYFLTGAELNDMVTLKERIRAIFNIANHSVHITDTKEEALTLSQIILNDNSVDLLNYGNPYAYPSYQEKLQIFSEAVRDSGKNSDDFIIDSGSVLALYGLRETQDIDFYYYDKVTEILPPSDIYEQHINYYYYYFYSVSLEALVFDPRNYMYFAGYKFISLKKVREMKEKRKELKDNKDVTMIKKLEKNMGIRYLPGEKWAQRKAVVLKAANSCSLGRFLLRMYGKMRSRS